MALANRKNALLSGKIRNRPNGNYVNLCFAIFVLSVLASALNVFWMHQNAQKTAVEAKAFLAAKNALTFNKITDTCKPTQKESQYRTPLAYGTKDGGAETANYVKMAILNGISHIATSSHHQKHVEPSVGEGWKQAVQVNPNIKRDDLFLQTMFVPWDNVDFKAQEDDNMTSTPTIEEQVHITISQSLKNLQTTYIDAVLYHNFRATLHPYEHMLRAWRVLEEYVQKGTIRYLGITNVHDIDYLSKLYDDSKAKISIVQNRFHANRNFDVGLIPIFKKFDIQVQRFWVLNGNGNGQKNRKMAKEKGLQPQLLMIAFVMSLGYEYHKYPSTVLIGTHDLEHVIQDVALCQHYHEIFLDLTTSDQERMEFTKNIGMKSHRYDLEYTQRYIE